MSDDPADRNERGGEATSSRMCPHAGIFGEEPEGVVERVEYPIRDVEAEGFRYIVQTLFYGMFSAWVP